MSRCAVILDGQAPQSHEVAERLLKADWCVAADGGAAYALACGRVPDMIVGDMDSADGQLLSYCQEHGASLRKLSCEKDETDGEMAMRAALETGCDEILLFGFSGGRLDHLLANIGMAYEFFTRGTNINLVDDGFEGYFSNGFLEVSGEVGDVLSLIPMTPKVSGVTLQGLMYPLDNATLFTGVSRSLCNELAEPLCRVSHKEGILLILHYTKMGARKTSGKEQRPE